ncbi:hypothetical protein JYU34_010939 [Plutella xylostella]|uniref:Uncharacterized protein n=1 Tax=Plutella xylostella TaxID=51655 RepID=A0ABQ7QFN4_PLUXY|nr:hypothetical protein JYU34_010939 [Plutella xylostella]
MATNIVLGNSLVFDHRAQKWGVLSSLATNPKAGTRRRPVQPRRLPASTRWRRYSYKQHPARRHRCRSRLISYNELTTVTGYWEVGSKKKNY